MPRQRSLTPRMISDFCRVRLTGPMQTDGVERISAYLTGLLELMAFPPYRGKWIDWAQVAASTGLEAATLVENRQQLQPVFDALSRAVAMQEGDDPVRPPKISKPATVTKPAALPAATAGRARRGPRPKAIVEFPEPITIDWVDADDFGTALVMHMRRHGDSVRHLYLALASRGEAQDQRTLMKWCTGQLLPRTVRSLVVLNNIERRYRLPMGYFRAKLPHQARAIRGVTFSGLPAAERRRMAWHLPEDFPTRPKAEQEEIIEWVRTVVISGSTDYRRFQAAAMKQRYAVRFTAFQGSTRRPALPQVEDEVSDLDLELQSAVTDAPVALDVEMNDLLRFKTATLTAFGFQRNGVWNDETASQKVEHLGLMFGALASDPRSTVKGAGVPPDSLCFAMLIFPAVWDWYLQWRERRRGFYTKWEVDMLSVVLSMARAETGWIRQNPSLADRLRTIPGMISQAEIDRVRKDWDGSCDAFYKHARHRIREIQRVARIHRDPFEPILPVLEADSPVGEYRKITEEIVRLIPDEARYPRAAAEAVRSFLLIRLGMHTGLRQRNLRELLVCPRGRMPTSERHLEDKKRGELRWSDRDGGWEVLIPSVAFKNSTSSFFGSKPFRLVLPDLAGLYDAIDAYIDRHRARLIADAKDPGTFFVKSVKRTSADAAYNQNTFYEAWRLTIQRYGIYNPYTGRGAIEGLLPHGPHNVRDVLATHILKQTGSYEQASYAIQDTPAMVQQHYGRFLPQDKAAIAAKILNRVWEAA
ncbi:MAG: hypothetical protein P0Y65_20840 [Candidatus Devosia phytovorans]|uniref:Uncharacterized protein n=1 Tax=Candidatus Devosia phytovorans TaxID=3121372 RepID=A0AAJ5VVC9_9HYPH|nr:hypothetical protein [Devosia sp.]WEK04590.1 MAG: hypothetical protein P0Y65_20840 [Devosia sp.]